MRNREGRDGFGVEEGPPCRARNPETPSSNLAAGRALPSLILLLAVLVGLLNLGASKCAPPRLPPVTPPTAKPPGPGPTPKPPSASCPVITDDDAAIVPQAQQWAAQYALGIAALQTRHPDWFDVDENTGHWKAPRAGDHAVYPTAPEVEAFRAQFYRALGAEFHGLCAQTIGDELHVFDPRVSPIVSERYKPFEQGGGAEMQRAYQGRTLAVVLGGPVATPTPKATPPAGDPSTCSADTPDASTFVLDVRWNSAHTVAWVDATGKINDRDWCFAHYGPDGPWPNDKALVVCPTRPEGNPARVDCDRKHGTPVWFMALDNGAMVLVASDENDPFHLHAPLGATVKACRAADVACSEPTVLR